MDNIHTCNIDQNLIVRFESSINTMKSVIEELYDIKEVYCGPLFSSQISMGSIETIMETFEPIDSWDVCHEYQLKRRTLFAESIYRFNLIQNFTFNIREYLKSKACCKDKKMTEQEYEKDREDKEILTHLMTQEEWNKVVDQLKVKDTMIQRQASELLDLKRRIDFRLDILQVHMDIIFKLMKTWVVIFVVVTVLNIITRYYSL